MDTNITDNHNRKTQEQVAFEEWYVTTTFDIQRSPIGSRDCFLQRRAWEAAINYAMFHKPWEIKGTASSAQLEPIKSKTNGSSIANVTIKV